MARRHYLVSYDISDDKRRNKVFQALHDNGEHVQFSVFLCQLNAMELAKLKSTLRACIASNTDQLLILNLGLVHYGQPLPLETIGMPYVPAVRAKIV